MPFRDPRSWGLAGGAGVYLSRAAAYRPGRRTPLPDGLADVAAAIATGVYGAVWAAGAAGLLVVAWRKIPVSAWMTVLLLPPVLWGAFYFVGGVTQRPDAALWAALMFLVLVVTVAAALRDRFRRWMVILLVPPMLWGATYFLGVLPSRAEAALWAAFLFGMLAVMVGSALIEPPKPARKADVGGSP